MKKSTEEQPVLHDDCIFIVHCLKYLEIFIDNNFIDKKMFKI